MMPPPDPAHSPPRHPCPSCGTHLQFSATTSRHQRGYARCPGCGADLVLYGGQVTIVTSPPLPGGRI
ncbi:MAG: hypothetical protein KDA98_08725 [Acidimicrobiales bacterium]|nr:hypothetical protein [Acidimicrobiales bacterium]